MKNPDILIVGAGPTGLTLANFLAKAGVDFIIIDGKEKPSQDSKAFGIHARSIEIFSCLGLAEKLIEEGNIDNTFHIMSKDREVSKFKLNTILPGETPYPYFLILPQDKTEDYLVNALKSAGHHVQWNHKLIELTHTNKSYSAGIRDENGKHHHIAPKYIVGCDGADSTVRKKAGISFEGKSFKQSFYLADVVLNTKLVHGDVYFTLAPNHLSVIFSYKKKDLFRVFNFLNSAIHKKKNEKLDDGEVQKILDDNPALNTDIKKILWTSVYNIHCRLAEKFIKGNILLAGDAAHVHSPVGGQGMNTGIQDAYNLAWKISWVLKLPHTNTLIDSYHQERFPIAKNLHYSTDRFFQLIIKRNKLIDLFRMYVFPYAFLFLSNRFFLKVLFRRVSQIAIKYRNSALSKNINTAYLPYSYPKAGDRAPWVKIFYKGERNSLYHLFQYPYFTLLLASGPDKYQDILTFLQKLLDIQLPMLKVYFISKNQNGQFYKTYGITSSAIYLIRPDGHIGMRSEKISINPLKRYYDLL